MVLASKRAEQGKYVGYAPTSPGTCDCEKGRGAGCRAGLQWAPLVGSPFVGEFAVALPIFCISVVPLPICT